MDVQRFYSMGVRFCIPLGAGWDSGGLCYSKCRIGRQYRDMVLRHCNIVIYLGRVHIWGKTKEYGWCYVVSGTVVCGFMWNFILFI